MGAAGGAVWVAAGDAPPAGGFCALEAGPCAWAMAAAAANARGSTYRVIFEIPLIRKISEIMLDDQGLSGEDSYRNTPGFLAGHTET
jgi:hypothetical protein